MKYNDLKNEAHGAWLIDTDNDCAKEFSHVISNFSARQRIDEQYSVPRQQC